MITLLHCVTSTALILPLLLFIATAIYPTNSTEIVVRIPKLNPSQATALILQDGSTTPNVDTSLIDIRFNLSDTNNYCVNVEGVDIVTSTTFDLPSKCTLLASTTSTTNTTTTNDTANNDNTNSDEECFNIAVASGNDAQATITETTSGSCNAAFANGIRTRATLTSVESHNNATAIGEDATATVHSSKSNNTAIANGNRCLAEITDSHNDNRATTNGNDAQSKVITGYYSSATAGYNTTTDTGNSAIAIGAMATAIATNGTYNFANALHSNTLAYAGDGNYNNATAVNFGANSTARGGDSNSAIANDVGTTAVAGRYGSFNRVNATGMGSYAAATHGDGNTVTTDGMSAHASSTYGNYNELIIRDGIMAQAEVTYGDRNIITILNGTMSSGTIISSSDSQVTCSGFQSFGTCERSDRCIVNATSSMTNIMDNNMDGLVNVTIIGGSDNRATAQADNTTITILDAGSYNQVTATTMDCTILISNNPVGGETQSC